MKTDVRTTVIRVKLSEMAESVALVRENLPDSVDSFAGMGLLKDGIYKRMEYAIENVYDICAILNADLHLGVPGGDAEILENLMQHGVISSDMGDSLRKMKGFRNIVVHRYGRIDDAIAFTILQAHLDDFAAFREEIEQFLGSAGA
ncbi:type VII toxin-antitoxin system HepT family RNase toxin [Methanogenium organophilum]|uniref:DUF86 domain-containing protein n=1 Tax=Methanogenium organophilum TaxID=2199 RepID=A0A9X9T8L8_METOG|nr:DUF86 domain-containing protein [Methanogenium organophilum]WAI01825.1 DUF86 domain-containing protein [Methanogenium organophilum]